VIDAADTLTIEWVTLEDILWDDQPLDPAQVDFYAGMLTGHDGHLSPPVLNADFTIRDGHHRLAAHERAGRSSARCVIVSPE
jgi:hypothetical protein